jgi:hypothetical protein
MKKVIICKADLKTYSTYDSGQETSKLMWWDDYQSVKDEYVELEQGDLDPDCLKAILIDDVITLVEDPILVAAKAKSAKDAQISELRASFDNDVDAQMLIVYGTPDRVTAGVINQSWNDMNTNVNSYVPGIFPSVNAAQAYVNEKLAAATAFNIWRIGRLAQRDAAIAAL